MIEDLRTFALGHATGSDPLSPRRQQMVGEFSVCNLIKALTVGWYQRLMNRHQRYQSEQLCLQGSCNIRESLPFILRKELGTEITYTCPP